MPSGARRWRAIQAGNTYRVKISQRFDGGERLDGLRRERSRIPGRNDRREVGHGLYDIRLVRLVRLRDHCESTWVTVTWQLLSSTVTPVR
ncbi:hypothetical protein OHA74_39035 [Streptomyces phaeochromogenes]|uniref:hypothetical protein n=1 Tax=Streptomyces phaeochromogenes TaxID=1923 RepID=UPI002E2C6A28|nr:hypothetical protein [Streptomyces phaeochromogenes]